MRTGRVVRGWVPPVTAAALALVTGCSSGGGAVAAPRPEKSVLNVAVDPGVDSAGFFIALDRGLFKAQGLDVNFIPATSGQTAIAGQVTGAYDITGGNYVSYIQAQQQSQADLDIFAEGSVMGPGTQGIFTTPGSSVRTLADLKGRTVAISAPNNILYLLTASLLTDHGISPKSVRFASIPFIEMPAELESTAVSAAVLTEPYASDDEEDQGDVSLADLDQGATTSFPVEGYAVTKQWAAKYPHTLAAFYRALEQGQQIADTSRAAVEQAMENMPAPYGVSADTAAVMALDSYPVSTGPVGTVDKVRLQRVADVMTQFLGFPKFDIGSMLIGG
ncbi:MAG TPA: ABC transporter substrate-binding protein [Streptosporangiaceae bacterium]